ncbi:unnamed protein product, partial [Urochloa humidicola]
AAQIFPAVASGAAPASSGGQICAGEHGRPDQRRRARGQDAAAARAAPASAGGRIRTDDLARADGDCEACGRPARCGGGRAWRARPQGPPLESVGASCGAGVRGRLQAGGAARAHSRADCVK